MNKGIYELITELCEKHVDKKKYAAEGISILPVIKKLRTVAFEYLLKKKVSAVYYNEMQDNLDPICHLLAWQFTLNNVLNHSDMANEVGEFINRLNNSGILEDPVVNNVILLLFKLRNSIPNTEIKTWNQSFSNKIQARTCKTNIEYDQFFEDSFELPLGFKCNECDYATDFDVQSFASEPNLNLRIIKKSNTNLSVSYSNYKFLSLNSVQSNVKILSTKKSQISSSDDEATVEIPASSENIWELASKLSLNCHRNWESLGVYDPIKEVPFALESGSQTLQEFEKVTNVSTLSKVDSILHRPNFISIIQFIDDVKYMLVGIASQTFIIDEREQFCLKRNISIRGLSHEALHSFCEDLMFCGSCYKSLHEMCSSYFCSSFNKFGFIFKELCESIKRYLMNYRVIALSVPVTLGLLSIHKYLHGIKNQIGTLARLCKVGPFSYANEDMPRGAELLTYLYQEIIKVTDKNVQLVLYSAFYPCCQIYFRRFLQCWLFEGNVIDPYEEFLVKVDTHYMNSRCRTYWTRCFSLRANSIPDFLFDLRNEILQCGKTMNLLKLCKTDNLLSTYVAGKSLPLISCCLTSDQFNKTKQEFSCYYISAAALCGPRISLLKTLQEKNEENFLYLSLVAQKRALSSRKIELERRIKAEKKATEKRIILEDLKEQMRIAADNKKKEKEDELKRDLLIAEQNAHMEEMKSKLIKAEANNLIKYYNTLIESVDKRKASIKKYTEDIKEKTMCMENLNANSVEISEKSVDIEQSLINIDELNKVEKNDVERKENEIFTIKKKDSNQSENKEQKQNDSHLDVLNANVSKLKSSTLPSEVKIHNQINEAHLEARRNRAKIMNLEFGMSVKEIPKQNVALRKNDNLTDAQRNKLKVLSSEFNIFNDGTSISPYQMKKSITDNNRNINEKNESLINIKAEVQNLNLASPGEELVMNANHKQKLLSLPENIKNPEMVLRSNNAIYPGLNLDINKCHSNNNLSNEPTPMSIDSTPLTEFATPSSSQIFLSTENILDSAATLDSALTFSSNVTDEGFKFPETKTVIYEDPIELKFVNKKIFSVTEHIPESVKPMTLNKEEVEGITSSNLKILLHQSVLVPLEVQIKLVNSEILKYYLMDQEFFSHLHSLRCYYFLLDGEFGRRITEGLFNKLYEVKNPVDMLNCRTLQLIMSKALFASSKMNQNSSRLSFTIQNIPKTFNLSSIDVLDCLSMSYRITWPLNIILTNDVIEKYEMVFKYLLKLHHVSWIMKKIFQDLKLPHKNELHESVLLQSPQYHKLQLYRHVITHFIQTLQNYTISEVLQTSWEELEHNMKSVTTFDQLYSVHILYVKTIIFRCLLNKKCAPIMKVINEIFMVILKFYNYLKLDTWIMKEGTDYFVHPQFKKLNDIFQKFEEFTKFVFRLGNKMAKVGYQPHLMQMLDMLNMNDYYTNKFNT